MLIKLDRRMIVRKFIIAWDAGFGPSYETVEAETLEKATRHAYEQWREEAEGQSEYSAEEWTADRAEELDLDD